MRYAEVQCWKTASGAQGVGEKPSAVLCTEKVDIDRIRRGEIAQMIVEIDKAEARTISDKWVDELCDRLLHALTKYSTDASMRWVTREKLHAIVHSSMYRYTTSMDAERTKVLQNSESLRADI